LVEKELERREVMGLGLQITTTGFVVAICALLVVTLLRKTDPPDNFKVVVVTVFILGAIAMPVGVIVSIWT